MLSPEEISARDFLVSLRGYDREEVRAFLAEVSEEMRVLHGRIAELETESAAAADAVAAAPLAAIEEPRAAQPSALFAEIGEETRRILEAAQSAGEDLQRKARQEVEREVQRARDQATKLIADGERRREQIERTVTELERARDALAEDLVSVGRSLEEVLRHLAPRSESTTSVREALAADLRADAGDAHPQLEDAQPQVELDAQPVPEPQPEPLLDTHPHLQTEEAEPETVEGPDPATPVEKAEADTNDPLTLRAAALGPLHPKLVRRVKRGLQDLQNATLDRLRRAGGRGEAESFAPTEAEVAYLGAQAEGLLDQAYAAGVAAAGLLARRELGEPDVGRDLVGAFRRDTGERVATGVAGALRMGLAAGEPLPALNQRVSGVFAELKGPAAEEMAAGQLLRAYELGLLDAWATAGIASRRWVLGKEPRCPEARCRGNDQVGSLAVGQAFPSGHEVPPVHAGCTCTTVPELQSEPT